MIFQIRNSFHIVLDGLKSAYHIWRLHLIFLILEYIVLYVRPVWQTEPASYIYGNTTICFFWVYMCSFFFIISSFLVTLFAFTKAKIYFTIHHKKMQSYFTALVLVGLVPGFLAAALVQAGPSKQDGINNCHFQPKLARILTVIYALHWIVPLTLRIFRVFSFNFVKKKLFF